MQEVEGPHGDFSPSVEGEDGRACTGLARTPRRGSRRAEVVTGTIIGAI